MSQRTLSACLFIDNTFAANGWRDHLERRYGAKIRAESRSKEGAVRALLENSPDLVVMDLTLSCCMSFDLIRKARSRPQTRVLIVSAFNEGVFAERCLRAGAHGFISASADVEECDQAIRTVIGGDVYLSQQARRALMDKLIGNEAELSDNPYRMLTPREMQVFVRTGHGNAPRDIARDLQLSVKTVESYREKIKDKLGLRNSHEVYKRAIECVLFDFNDLSFDDLNSNNSNLRNLNGTAFKGLNGAADESAALESRQTAKL